MDLLCHLLLLLPNEEEIQLSVYFEPADHSHKQSHAESVDTDAEDISSGQLFQVLSQVLGKVGELSIHLDVVDNRAEKVDRRVQKQESSEVERTQYANASKKHKYVL